MVMRESNSNSSISADPPQRIRAYGALLSVSLAYSLILVVSLSLLDGGLTGENALRDLLSISWFGIPFLPAFVCWISTLVSYAMIERKYHLTRFNILVAVFSFPVVFASLRVALTAFNEFYGCRVNIEDIVTWSGALFVSVSLLLAAIIAMLSKTNSHERAMKYLSWISLVAGLIFFTASFLYANDITPYELFSKPAMAQIRAPEPLPSEGLFLYLHMAIVWGGLLFGISSLMLVLHGILSSKKKNRPASLVALSWIVLASGLVFLSSFFLLAVSPPTQSRLSSAVPSTTTVFFESWYPTNPRCLTGKTLTRLLMLYRRSFREILSLTDHP